jgi:hypothetical protein
MELWRAVRRYDGALRHMREARDLTERAGGDWLGAGSRLELGILAVLRGGERLRVAASFAEGLQHQLAGLA